MSDLKLETLKMLTKLRKAGVLNADAEATRIDAFAQALAETPEALTKLLENNDSETWINAAKTIRDARIIDMLTSLPSRTFVKPLFTHDGSTQEGLLEPTEADLVYRAASLPKNKRSVAALYADTDPSELPIEPPRKRTRHLDTEEGYTAPADELRVLDCIVNQQSTPPADLKETAQRVKWVRICETASKLQQQCPMCNSPFTTYRCDYRFLFYSDTTIYTNRGQGYDDMVQIERSMCTDCGKAQRERNKAGSTSTNTNNDNVTADTSSIQQ